MTERRRFSPAGMGHFRSRLRKSEVGRLVPLLENTQVSTFPVYDVSDWLVTDMEPSGHDRKYWLRGAAGEPEELSWLFKYATVKEVPRKRRVGGGTRAHRKGEDWVEKVASEFAELMGLPAVRVELASRDGASGLISRDVKPRGWTLNGGGVLIAAVDDRYRRKTNSDKRRNRVGHSIENIHKILTDVKPPPGFALPELSAFEVFAGFLIFDAWIVNRDRHEFNWGLLRDPEGALYLSPSFDHGAALASGFTADKKAELSRAEAIEEWCTRATAHRFEDRSEVSLVALASEALALCSGEARSLWQANVSQVTIAEWQNVLNRVPFLSEESRRFTSEVLRINQERIRDELGSAP